MNDIIKKAAIDQLINQVIQFEIEIGLPQEREPGDFSKLEYARARGMTIKTAEYRLSRLVQEGYLTIRKVSDPVTKHSICVYRIVKTPED